MTDEDNGSFLDRWSRRKRAAPAPEPAADVAPDPEAQAREAAAQARNREAAEAIDLTTLSADTDMSLFFRDGVPAVLRQRALAALWRTDAVFSNVDGLVDYGEDFGRSDLVMKTFASAWQAGRGYLKDAEPAPPDPTPEPDAEEAPALAKTDEPPPIDELETHPLPEPATEAPGVSPPPPVDMAVDRPSPSTSLRRRLGLQDEA